MPDAANSGALFRNKDPRSDKSPLYKGSCRIGGAEFWVSGWMKESEKGEKYMSLAFRPKDPGTQPAETPF